MAREVKSESAERARLSGTLTFLFSDIEGSTRRWETKREAMARAVKRHETLMRESVERHEGLVFKTVGDAFCCAFTSTPNALHAALDAQRSHGQVDFSEVDGLKVRMALHAGSAEERDGDFFGPTVNRVARLMSIGHGGQVLLSNAAHELVKHDAPLETGFLDLGSHQLKDLAQPERVWQAATAGLRADFPPLRSLAAFPNNLPLQVTSFHGREDDLREIKRYVNDYPLVTIFGAGGVGKTRLAIQSGAELLDQLEDGVWIADLAPVHEEQSVVSVVAQSLGVDQSQASLSNDAIVGWLRQKQALLILDNCEHLLDAVARLADAIIRHCANVRLMVTSRQALAISGEKVFRLPSLDVPQPAQRTLGEVARCSAVALFADRAALADRAFRLNEENAPVVAAVCRRLDGIPLAIELAAARLRTMSLSSLAQHLDERFKILTGGSRAALPRQQTLRALIDWSYDLLPEQERALFSRLSVFAGSFTLEAAEHICAGQGIQKEEVLNLLCSLADKSLVISEIQGLEQRYFLLESTRDYAREKLRASGLGAAFSLLYARYYLDLATQWDRDFGASQSSHWIAEVECELHHFRAVLEWSLAEGNESVIGASLAAALEMFWWHGGTEAEGRFWIEAAAAKIDPQNHADVAARLAQAQARLTSRILFS